jgi:hypothetical protein
LALSVQANWAKHNFQLVKSSQNELNKQTTVVLQDKNDQQLQVIFKNELSDQQKETVAELHKKITAWQGLEIQSIKYILISETVEIVIIPQKLVYKKMDLQEFLPAGLHFIYNKGMRYDFRMVKDKIFVKIYGRFISADLLWKKIYEAVKDPVAYARRRDPEYFLSKLDQLTDSLSKLYSQHWDLKKEHEKLQKKHATLKNAVIHLHHRGFFGNIEPVKDETIKKILQLVKKSPRLTHEQIANRLRAEGVKVTEKEIMLVLAVYHKRYKK